MSHYYSYSWLLQTLLVVCLLLETPSPVECRSPSKDSVHDQDPIQVIERRWREREIIRSSTAANSDDWRVCGELRLPPQFRIVAANRSQSLILSQPAGVEMDVSVSPETGTVKCKCHQVLSLPTVDTVVHQATFEVLIADRKDNHFTVVLPLEAPCQLSFCQRKPTTLLMIDQHLTLNLSLECWSMLREQHRESKNLLQRFDDGIMALSLPSAARESNKSPKIAYGHGMDGVLDSGSSLSPNQHHHQMGQLCTIDVIRSITTSNGTRDPDSAKIKFIQSLPLDLPSCISVQEQLRGRQAQHAANGRHTIFLSVRPWSSGQYSTLTHPHSSAETFTSSHAKPSTNTQLNAIHDEGGSMPWASSTKHGNGGLREIRQTSTSPPQFNDTFYMASVLENSPLHTVVTGVRAIGNAPITYSMTPDSGFSEGLFSMNRSTGVVTTTDLIDREMIESHSFRIQALDASGRFSIAQMTITVEDENDNVPTFERSYFNITVDEDTDRTSTILRFSVEDDDLGQNGIVDFLLVNNTDNTFTVANSGTQVAIVLNQYLDYESNRFYLLTISARDRGNPTQSSSATLEIHVIDVADSIPQFNATSYSTQVAEDTSPPAYLLTVHATSEDSAPLADIQYIKVSGDSNNQFSINGNTGVITLTKSLDFETTQVHAIVIQAQSVANPILHSQTNVHITVSNVNDHYPIFTRQMYSISVLETVSSGHLVITVDAPDLDEGVFGDVFYQFSVFTEQAIYDTFSLDSTSGQITTSTSLDREQRDEYTFTVVARDGGTPALSSTSRVSVTVSDVNDEPPIFSQREYSASISENLDAGRSVTQVFAEDRDSVTSVVNYYIQSGNINNAFGIESQDGLITTRTRLDREEYASYNLVVVASDGINENTTRVLISVLDINDESPTFELSLYNLPAISEGFSVDGEVGRVQALDPDDGSNGQVTYTSTNIDQKFRLDQMSGAILLSSSLDYEETERYVFDVTATDGGQPPLSSTARVQISVLDENDNSPVFDPHPLVLSILENQPAGAIITKVTATDADTGSNSAVQYEIVGDIQAKRAFGIRQNGEVYTQESLDREVIGQYQLIIQAADGGAVRQSTTMTVTVNVDDIIDYPPIFSQVVYEVLINSPFLRGLPVVTVHARTLDLVQPQSIIYYITSGANSTLFRMDQATGMIFAETTIDPLIHEGVYRMGVVAQHRHLSESVFVIVRVMLDDGIPRLRPLTLYFSAYSSLIEQRNHLGVVEIVQPKEELEYTFSLAYSDSRQQRHFFINPTTGYLSVVQGVASGHYQLNVSASTATNVGFVLVDVFVTILTNQTLENTIVATFGGAREATFASIQLDQFIQFLIEVIACSRTQVEIVGIQRSGAERDEMVSVAFAVLQSDHTTYIPRERIMDMLQANRHNVQPSTILSFTSDVCSEEPCSNLQRCLPVVEVHRHSAATPFKIISSTHHFHVFRESFVCSCPEGYSRDDLCSTEINECDPSPCYFGAECSDFVGDYRCKCPSGTYDKNCSSVCVSRESCNPCDPNPCLHGGNCIRHVQDLTSYRCEACPWRNEYSGPNCELTTVHFRSEWSSFMAFQPIYGTSRFDLNLRFTTISPNGLLFYSGQLENQDDYIAAELVIGQLRVGVSLGGVPTTLTTDCVWNLNDGLWHSVSIKLKNRVLMVEVSDCSRQPVFLEQVPESCQLETELHPEAGRTLELSTLLYFGGIEPHIPHDNILSSAFKGCIADVKLGGQLLDFNQPEREEGTEIGCPPLEGSCSRICPRNKECVQLWGGSVCNCETDSCVGGSSISVQLSTGFIHFESSSTITLMSFILYFRTRSSDAVLVQLGSYDSLELKYGSIIYRRGYSSSNMHTPLTLEVLGAVSDGVWHKVRLDVNNTHTKLSVDDGRSSASIPEGGIMRITTVTLGAEMPNTNSSRFSGCLAEMVINAESINLVNALANTIINQHFQVSTHMAVSGCGAGSPCSGIECPDSSQCEAGWQNYSCVCDLPNRVIDDQCVDPCSTEPCKNGGTCEVVPFGSVGFHCTCVEGFPLPTCELVEVVECGAGFHEPPACNEPCPCDPKGTVPAICDGSTGRCMCKANLDVYSVSGGVGCQQCDCHAIGSVLSKCNEDTGQCLCRENVRGRRCDQCTEDFAGMDEFGCKTATVVYGTFSFSNLFYERELGMTNSPTFKELSQRIVKEIERELYSFALPGRFEVDILSFTNSSGLVMVEYKVSSYLPRGSLDELRPSYSILAGVMQMMVQSGRVGPLHTNSSSHIVPIVCSQVPELCSGCPNSTTRDGIICRAPATCPGVDSDRDGIPNSCDNCPYDFNPNQNSSYCKTVRGVCPADLASGIAWSKTSVGMVDIKRCPSPLLGFASRTCMAGEKWSDVDLLGCISVAGQEFLAQAESMDNGQTLSFPELREAASNLEVFTNEQGQTTDLIGGDVQVAGRVVDRLLRQLRGYAASEAAGQDELLALFGKLVSISDKLLSPTPAQGWVGVVEEAGFGSGDFLATLEQLPVASLINMWENASSSSENLVTKTRRPSTSNGNELYFSDSLSLNELSASLELPLATLTSSVAMAMFSNLGQALTSFLFISNASDPLSVATPILSIQMFNEADKVTALTTPINLTLPYRERLFLPDLRSRVRCAWWQSGERSGWSTEGCEMVSAASKSHVTCRCTHLTAFAAILPARAFTVVQMPPGKFSPSTFTYIIFSLVFILFLVTLLFLVCLRHMQDLLNTTHKNLVFALLLITLFFAVGIDRIEVGAVCSAFGIVMFYLFMVCMSWMVANGVIIARFLLDTPPKETFAITLYIIGWALPALVSGIAIGSVSIINPTEGFLSKFGYPYYCWISEYSFGGLVAPALLLIVLYIITIIIIIALRIRLRKVKERGRNVSVAATTIRNNTSVVLLKSISMFILFLVSWSLGLLAVFLRDKTDSDILQYAFAAFYGVFGVLVVIILCVNKHFMESLKLQFTKQPDVIIGDMTGPVYAEIRKPPTNHRRSSGQRQQHRPPHQHRGRRFRKQTPLMPAIGERVELMTIAPVPTHPPPSPRAINNQGSSLAPYSQSSPLLRNTALGEGHHGQEQNRAISERHIAENQEKPSILHVPETRPFSPLTYGSDTGSHVSNMDDIDHVPSILRRTREEIDGVAAAGVVQGVSNREKDDLYDAPRQSPTLTELYEQARKSSSRTSGRSYNGEERAGSSHNPETGDIHPNLVTTPTGEGNGLAGVCEDPLWYKPVQSEYDPMPYETAVRSPPLVTSGSIPVSPTGVDDGERRRMHPIPPMTSQSSHHSDSSEASSSKHSSTSRTSSRNRSPSAVSPANVSHLGQEHSRKHSLPMEWAKKQGNAPTTNPLYSSSAAVPVKKHSQRKHHRSFNSQTDGQPLPPLPPGGPIHTSPLPPLPYPPKPPGGGCDATRHTHFATSIPTHHHHQVSDPSPELPPRSTALPYTLPPPSHIKDAPLTPKVEEVPHQLSPTSDTHPPPIVRDAPPPTKIKNAPHQPSTDKDPPSLSCVKGSSQLPHEKDPPEPPKFMSSPVSQACSPTKSADSSPRCSLNIPKGAEERRSVSCSSSPAQQRQKKKRSLDRDDSYHSEGPSAERKKKIFRHSDGSKTVQSLV